MYDLCYEEPRTQSCQEQVGRTLSSTGCLMFFQLELWFFLSAGRNIYFHSQMRFLCPAHAVALRIVTVSL